MSPSQSSPVPTLTTQPSIYSPQPVYHPNVRSPSLHSQKLSDYGSNIQSPSLLGPPLTRDHSAATSNSTAGYLPTPTDEAMHPPPAPLSRNETTLTTYYRNQAFPERLGSDGQVGKGQSGKGIERRPRVATSRAGPSTRTQTDVQGGTTARRHVVPLGQRIVAGLSSSPVTAPRMVRQRSARELISQYNEFDSLAQASVPPAVASNSGTVPSQQIRSVSSISLSPRRDALLPPVPTSDGGSDTSPGSNTRNPPRVHPSHCLPESPSYFSTFARSRGKMRDSLTNLIQLLGDKAKTKDKDGGSKAKDNPKKRNSVSPSTSFRAFSHALPRGFKLNLGKRTSLGSSPSWSPGKDKGGEKTSNILPDMNELLKSEPEMSALLLYQSPARQGHSHSNHTPWMPYSVSMYPTSIILQIPNPGLSSTNKFQIPLSDLYDTHSVPLKELPPEVIPAPGSLPPGIGFGEEIYVFEMYCYGGRVERFAAPNMATRAKWVAYLLDALMNKNAQARKDGVATPPGEFISASTSPTPAPPTKPIPINDMGERAEIDDESSSTSKGGSRTNLAPSPSSLTRSAAAATTSVESMPCPSLDNTSEQIPVPAPEPPLTSTRILGCGRNARSTSTNSRTTSVFPNPWDPPSTTSMPASATTPRPPSSATQRTPSILATPRTSSFLMSPRSDRSCMTASPSICRLDERNLVRNRLAMFERQASPSPMTSQEGRSSEGGSLRGAGGTMNWEALNEVRSGRAGSSLLRSGMRVSSPAGPRMAMSPGPRTITSPRPLGGVLSPNPTNTTNNGADTSSIFRPRWPFPEPSIPASRPGPSGLASGVNAEMHGSNGSIPGPINSPRGLNAPTPGPGILTSKADDLLPASERQANSGSLFARPTNRSLVVSPPAGAPEPVLVLGNLPPSKKSAPKLVEDKASESSFGLVSERLASLSAALRESDVAHSTKASGLGQLIASTQDHVIHAVKDSTKVSSQEHATTTRHLERLQDTVKELADRPTGPNAEERVELMAIKETLERIDRAISLRLEDMSGERERVEREEMKSIVVQHIEGLKQTVQDLTFKMENGSTQSDILAKLDAISGAIPSNASVVPTPDPGSLEGFVQQIKDHISALPAPSLDAPEVDTSELMLKLDSIAAAVTNPTLQVDLSDIQKILEEIRDLAQGRQHEDAPLNSTSPGTDLSDVLMKLDGIAAMCQSFMGPKADSQAEIEDTEKPKQEAQDQLLVALREDAEHRTVQVQQMSELVRYSNELNAWLEKFVMNASTQMDSVGAGLGSLRRDLGLDPPLPVEGQVDVAPPPPSALQELRGMFAEQIKTSGEITTSLNALLAAFNEEQERNAQARQSLATDAVLKMIDVQRQEQERLLRQLATDLSSDIRGERIRFVEAMSQATSMNVQLHVEEFKKQLTHEVLALTDEVGRLREERKTIQHQIAQLFLVKSEHEAELRASESLPPKPVSSTRPAGN